MHVQLCQPAKSTCLKLFQTLGESTETCQAIPLFLSHDSVSAFSTVTSLQRGGLGRPAAGAFEPGLRGHSPCLEGRDLLLAKAGEWRGCLCITWVIGQHLQIVPGVTKLWEHHLSEMLYYGKT